jgi:phosphoglycolate phosphatase-like HAD superfamily hydrolase
MKGAIALVSIAVCTAALHGQSSADPLPSWNDGTAKGALKAFVSRVTATGTPEFVKPSERIAVFDNDGTLWAEQPMYVQAFFIFERIKALAPAHPEWRATEPFASVIKGDSTAALAGGEHGIATLAMATHAGMTAEEFDQTVRDWIATAKHPSTGRRFTEMVYQPMLEVLAYLRANGFKTFIVSGGGIEFIRPWAEEVYGIPPEQIVGSSIKTKFEPSDGRSALRRLPEVDFVDDGPGKPVGIQSHIGRRPIIAFGNSDGDLQMLQYVCGGSGARLCAYLHHTDATREWAYDRQSSVGRLDRGLDEAKVKGWTVIDIAKDWKRVFAAQQ